MTDKLTMEQIDDCVPEDYMIEQGADETINAATLAQLCALARIGRAALDAEPVAYRYKSSTSVRWSITLDKLSNTPGWEVHGLIQKPEVK